MKCRVLPRAGRHRPAAPQRQLLRRALPASCAATRWPRPSTSSTCSRPASGCWWPCPAARTPWRCGTSCSTSATTPTASTSGSASATTATRRRGYARAFAAEPRRSTLHRDRPARRLRLRRPDGGRGDPAGAVLGVRAVEAPPVRPGRASTAATTSSPPATTSTTRPPCCSATCCAGTSTTSARQLPVLPARRRLPAQGQAARAPDRAGDGGLLRACAASTTSSRSARWRPATSTSATRRRSTPSRRRRRARKAAFYFGFLDRASAPLRGRQADAEQARRCGRAPRCGAPTTGEVCAFCRLVERGGRRTSRCRCEPRRRAGRAGAPMSAPLRVRRPGAAARRARAAATSSPSRRAASSTRHAGFVPHDELDRPAPRASSSRSTRGARLHRRCARRSRTSC